MLPALAVPEPTRPAARHAKTIRALTDRPRHTTRRRVAQPGTDKLGEMARRKASDVFVECLEAEGVRYVFGIPGEETLDLNESLADSSSVQFVPVRHEQGGAYMADAY